MRHFIIAFLLGLVLAGCYDMHGRFVPVIVTSDAGPMPVGDAGVPMPEPDSGPIVIIPDSGPVVTADAGMPGTDAGPPPEPDAGSDAGPVPEPDAGSEPDAGTEPDAGPLPVDPIIEAGVMPPSRILIAGSGRWESVASYEVVRDGVESLFVMIDGFAEDTSQVAIAHYDAALGTEVIIGRTVLPSGENSGSTIILDAPLETGDAFEIWVMIPPVVSNAVSGGDHDHFPMSGDTFRMGVNGVTRAGMFSVIPPLYGNEFVIRRSVPIFTTQALSSTNLVNGLLQAYMKFQVSADGEIGMAQVAAFVSTTSLTGRVCRLRLVRGSTEMIWGTDYVIVNSADGTADPDACFSRSLGASIFVRFLGEQVVTGSGNAYNLIGTAEGFVTGDSVTSFLNMNWGVPTLITGYLKRVSSEVAIEDAPWGSPTGASGLAAGLVWSDLSEIPHSAAFGRDGGSRDWTNDFLVLHDSRGTTLVVP